VAACQRLTELTVTYPHPHDTSFSNQGVLLDKVETTRSAALEMVNACKELPDFDTIQIVYFLSTTALGWGGCIIPSFSERQNRVLRERIKGVADLVIDCLKEPGTRRREGEGRKKRMVRVIELSPDHQRYHLGPVKVEEYEV